MTGPDAARRWPAAGVRRAVLCRAVALRLPVQAALLALIAFATQPRRR